jgi:hypothetical protein
MINFNFTWKDIAENFEKHGFKSIIGIILIIIVYSVIKSEWFGNKII